MASAANQSPFPAVLIDTPVWLDYFRPEKRTYQMINNLMDSGRICCLALGVGELLITARNSKEMKIFQDFTQIFPVLREPAGAWVEAARLFFKIRKKHPHLSLRDCYVALMAEANQVILFTTNRELQRVGRTLGLQLLSNRMEKS